MLIQPPAEFFYLSVVATSSSTVSDVLLQRSRAQCRRKYLHLEQVWKAFIQYSPENVFLYKRNGSKTILHDQSNFCGMFALPYDLKSHCFTKGFLSCHFSIKPDMMHTRATAVLQKDRVVALCSFSRVTIGLFVAPKLLLLLSGQSVQMDSLAMGGSQMCYTPIMFRRWLEHWSMRC